MCWSSKSPSSSASCDCTPTPVENTVNVPSPPPQLLSISPPHVAVQPVVVAKLNELALFAHMQRSPLLVAEYACPSKLNILVYAKIKLVKPRAVAIIGA